MNITKKDLIRVANIVIADSQYAVDHASLCGFALAVGVTHYGLRDWLVEKLGSDFPTSLPDGWIYAEGL
jgi:hypothetical protein